MAFRFRLQKVQDHRQRLVDQQSSRVGEAAAAVARARQEVGLVDEQMAALLAGGAAAAEVDVRGMTQRRLWLDHLEKRRAGLSGQVARAEEELARQRAELTRLWRDLEVIKKLREKKKEEWLAEDRRRENQELDEVGQIRADRQQRAILAGQQAEAAGSVKNQPGV